MCSHQRKYNSPTNLPEKQKKSTLHAWHGTLNTLIHITFSISISRFCQGQTLHDHCFHHFGRKNKTKSLYLRKYIMEISIDWIETQELNSRICKWIEMVTIKWLDLRLLTFSSLPFINIFGENDQPKQAFISAKHCYLQ